MLLRMNLGVLIGLLSAFCFAGLNVLVKIASIPSAEMMFARGFVGVVLLTPFVVSEVRSLFHRHSIFVWIRFIAGALAVLALFYNIQINGAGLATAVANLTSLFVILFSIIFLRERLIFSEWIGIILVFLATFMLHSPLGLMINFQGSVIGLLGAFSGAIAIISLKKIANQYSAYLLVWGFCFFCGIISLFCPGPSWFCRSWLDVLALFLAGILGAAGQIFLTVSYRELPASLASAVTLSAILWSVILESLYFRELLSFPSSLSYLLMAIGLQILNTKKAKNQST